MRPFRVSMLLVIAAATFGVPLVPAQTDGACVVTSDPDAIAILDTHYLKQRRDVDRNLLLEAFEERNGLPGLQLTSAQGCGVAPDQRALEACVATTVAVLATLECPSAWSEGTGSVQGPAGPGNSLPI